MDVEEAGIGEGISEVIVTTRSASGEPNAAPIGIITSINDETGERPHFVKLYKGSQTLANVLKTTRLAANVTDDAVIFVKAAFEHLSEAYFSDFAGVPVLTKVNAWIVFDSILIEERSDYLYFRLLPRAVEIKRKEVKAINRGRNAVIEATILATRYNVTKDEGEKEELKKVMEQYAEIVTKCGGRREKEAMSVLEKNVLQRYGFRFA
jgi:hypothetical protein